MTDNSFIREVDEAVRRERYKALWDKFGLYVVAIAVALVVMVAGYSIWTHLEESQAESAGNEFTRALTFESTGDQAKANEIFEEMAKSGPAGYRILSRFQLASSAAKAGETDKAVEAYDALSKERGVDTILKGLATLQAATLRLDNADYAEMEDRLDTLANGNSAWRFSARELLGLSAFRHDDLGAAEEQFSALLVDAGTPPNMRDRANVILSLIVSATATESAPNAEEPKAEESKVEEPKDDTADADAPTAEDAAPANEATTN